MTLTLANLPVELDVELRRRAAGEQRPLTQVAVDALEAGLGLSGDKTNRTPGLATAIRDHFGPLGGIELPDPVRQPVSEPLDFEL